MESVLRDAYPYKEVIVVDDASTDHTGEILRRFPVTALRNDKAVGPSSARNIGAKNAKGEIVVFIDAHCIVEDSEWIKKFVQLFSDPQVGAVGGYFKPDSSRKRLALTLKPARPDQRLIKSANAAFRKVMFEQIGGFDLGIEWAGDAALTYKTQKSGWKIIHSNDVKVTHAEKLWSIKRGFTYGTCYFRLLRRYQHETLIRSRPMIMGLALTLGLILDVFSRLPVFTLTLLLFFVLLNGVAHDISVPRILTNGLYNTVWAVSYFLGAIYGLPNIIKR